MEVYHEIAHQSQDEDFEAEKIRAQKEFKQAQFKESLLMFEKGDKNKRSKRVIEEDSGDDEGDSHLVCNMTGVKWESFPFPIIVDSGACASVMPKKWCEHLPIRETQQSLAGE